MSVIGESGEKRKLPLLILSDPSITSADQAGKSGKIVALIFANIHAGEVDGKEAVLMFAPRSRPGERQVDFERAHRSDRAHSQCRRQRENRQDESPGTNGPSDGVGVRTNAEGYDLNRDFIKLETPEVRR